MKILKTCNYCGNEFLYRNCPSDNAAGHGKYCKKKCQDKNMSSVLKGKGIKPTKHFTAKNSHHPFWKADDVSYSGLHYWIGRKLGKPRECTNCGTLTAKKYEWANISGEYKRDLKDWVRLCVSCHRRMDGHSQKAWQTRRAQL